MKKLILWAWMLWIITNSMPIAHAEMPEIGQTIQITTRFHSFIGKPSWLIIVRDVDNDLSMPYLFTIQRGENFWLLPTHGRNYLITVSNLQINTYQSRSNGYGAYKINNFCHLESHGRIIHGESLYITIEGDLTPDPSSVNCQVQRFKDPNFSMAYLMSSRSEDVCS